MNWEYILKEVREKFGPQQRYVKIKRYIIDRFGIMVGKRIDHVLVLDGELLLLELIKHPFIPLKTYRILGEPGYVVYTKNGPLRIEDFEDVLRFGGHFYPCFYCKQWIIYPNTNGEDPKEIRRRAVSSHLRMNPECLYEALTNELVVGGIYLRGIDDVSEFLGAEIVKRKHDFVIFSPEPYNQLEDKILWTRKDDIKSSNR